MSKSNSSLLSNLSWKFAERISAQLVTVIVSIILARLLEPSDYGLISIVTILITLANVFVNDGFGSALIQKKDADALDFSSVLYFNIIFSAGIYLVLFFLAPLITAFYGKGYELLTPVIRVLGLRLIPSAVNSVQNAYISKKMVFRKFFKASIIGTVISAIVGIAMAYSGCGVWSLVAQYLTNTTVNTITLAFSIRKQPIFKFSFDRLKGLFGFGAKVLGTSLFITGYQELRAIIIGKVYSAKDLAFYDKAKQFPNLIITNINVSISAVLFPKMSSEQDDKEKIKATMKNSIRFSSFLMCPLMLGFATVAHNFVLIVLTEKWLPCVPLIQLFCIEYLFYPIHSANMQAIKAIGRSDILLRLEIVKKIIEFITLICLMKISVIAIVIGMTVCSTLFVLINAFPNKKLIGYSFLEQMKDILPAVIMSLIMSFAVYLISLLNLSALPLMVIQVVAGALVYSILSFVTRNCEFFYIINLAKSKLMK